MYIIHANLSCFILIIENCNFEIENIDFAAIFIFIYVYLDKYN